MGPSLLRKVSSLTPSPCRSPVTNPLKTRNDTRDGLPSWREDQSPSVYDIFRRISYTL